MEVYGRTLIETLSRNGTVIFLYRLHRYAEKGLNLQQGHHEGNIVMLPTNVLCLSSKKRKEEGEGAERGG